jgi:hypothetical protein
MIRSGQIRPTPQRPGKGRFLIGVKNPFPIRPAATASQRAPLRGHADRRIRETRREEMVRSVEPVDF